MNNPSFSSSALCIGLKKGLSALRSQLPAGACLWSMAICVWVLYYHVNSVTVTLNNLGELKKEASYLFAFVSVGLSGGLLPSAFMALMRLYKVPLDSPTNPRNRPKREVFLIAATSVMIQIFVGDSSASAATDRDQSEHQGEAPSSSSSGDDDNGRKHAKKDQSLPLSPGDVITVIATVGTGGDDRGAREGHRGAGSAGGGGGGDGGVCIPGASL